MYQSYEDLVADANKYKNDLAREFEALKKNQEYAEQVNNQNVFKPTAPQEKIVIKKDWQIILVLVGLVTYLVMKGKK